MAPVAELVAFAVATAFTVCVALLALRLLRTGRPALDAALLAFVWIGVVTSLLLGLGLLGLLRGDLVAALSLVGLGALATIPAARRRLRESGAELASWVSPVRMGWREAPVWLKVVSALALFLGSVRFIFLVWALPPFVWDSLTYHLTNVARWIQTGRIAVFEVPVLRIYLPADYEVFAAWFAIFFHHDGWIEASGLPAYVIVVLAVFAMARRFAMTRSASWIAALAMASTPALVLATTGTKNDPIMAALILLLLALVVDMAMEARSGRDQAVLGRVLAVALVWLVAVGTKTYMIHVTPGLMLVGVLLAGPSSTVAFLRRLPHRLAQELRDLSVAGRLTVAVMIAAAVLLGSFWYVRNLWLQGNPFFPYGVSILGQQVERPAGETRTLDLPTLAANLASLADKLGDKQERITPDLPNTTGWGWVAYGIGVPTLAWAIVRRRDFPPLIVGFLVCGVGLLLSSRTSAWNMRYMIWFPAAFALAAGAAYDGLFRTSRLGRGFAALFTICLALNYVTTVNYNLIKTDHLLAMLARPFADRQAAYLRTHVPYEYENALARVPQTAVLGYNVHANGFIYPLFRADFSQRLVYIPIEPSQPCEAIAGDMRAAGTRYLVAAPEHTDDAVLARLFQCGEEGSVLRELGAGLYVIRRDS
jgi:hypothetical protein